MKKIIRGAFWPDLKKAADPELQKKMGCDPTVSTYFSSEFLTDKVSVGELWILDAEEELWRDIFEDWKLSAWRESHLKLH